MLRQIAGRYQIQRRLGAGAWATVYEALDTGAIERRVAIKVFRRPPLDDSAVSAEEHARFRQGARAAGRLSHPNVVLVYDYGEDDEMAWIVMELVEGETLKAMMDRGQPIGTDLVLRIMGQILDALGYTHSRGVVHRDIKPANIMLTPERVVKIADFGVARLEDSSMTQAGTVLGSPSYMAPEQFRGDEVDHRADIWATGVILYQLLTGERPFAGSITSLMQKALYVEPVLPSRTKAAVPVQFDAVVAKALAKQPEARFASAMEFAEALRAAAARAEPPPVPVSEEPTRHFPPPPARLPTFEPQRRKRWLLPTALGGTAAIAVLLLLLAVPRDHRTAPTAEARAGSGETATPADSTPPGRSDESPPAPSAPPRIEMPKWTTETPPEQMPVQQAVVQPPPSPPALPPAPPGPDLKGAAAAAAAAFQCGQVVTTVGVSDISFRGAAPATEILAAQQALDAADMRAVPGQKEVQEQVEGFDPRYCGVLGVVRGAMTESSPLQVALGTASPLSAGQVLRIRVDGPDWPAHFYLAYLMTTGDVGHLVNQAPRGGPRASQLFTDPKWEVTGPFGTDLVVVIASDRPLFGGRRRRTEKLDEFAAALGPALRTAQENGGRVAAQFIPVRTVLR